MGVRVIGSRTGYLFRAIDPARIREASMSPKTTLKPQRRQEMEIIMNVIMNEWLKPRIQESEAGMA
ncbi:MAG TPA: hypothetical protein VI075_05260, partial [Methyloceanibacter sp.]